MAVYVYDATTGALASWCPGDGDPVADAGALASQGLASAVGLPALDATHAWDPATKTVISVTAPLATVFVATAKWILRFSPAEFQAIMASTDPQVQQFVYALNHTAEVDVNDPIMQGGTAYLASLNLIAQARVAAILTSG